MSGAESTIKYGVNWDNGDCASGQFPYEFDTYEEADAYGRQWTDECNARDGIDLETTDGYGYDVVVLCPPWGSHFIRHEDDDPPFGYHVDQLDYPHNYLDSEG
jgi:hypothetical protein